MNNWVDTGKLWVFMGGVLMYAASRAAGVALVRKGEAAAGRRAIGHFLPIAAVTLVAAAAGYGGVAVSIIFSTSVASLSLVVGSVLAMGPPGPPGPEQSEMRRRWVFAAPVAMLTWLAGLTGTLHWWHALAFLIEGAAIALAWREMDGQTKSARAPVIGVLNFGLAAVLAAVGAVMAVLGGREIVMSGTMPQLVDSPVLIVLGPILVAPMLVTGMSMVQEQGEENVGDAGVATTMAVGVMLLNLCVLLPVVMGVWGAMFMVQPHLSVHVLAVLQKVGVGFGQTPALPFPLEVWRVDNVVLVLLGIVLIPAALGRLRMGRLEGFLLMGIYMMYLVMSL